MDFFSTSLKINMFIVRWFPLQWNISDFFYQNRQRIESELTAAQSREPGNDVLGGEVPPFDALWMSLYVKQGELCVDQRPAVRKSAGQTLFSTISAHGGLLQTNTWKKVVWQVSERIRSRSLHVQQSFVMIDLLSSNFIERSKYFVSVQVSGSWAIKLDKLD